jgi:hypothetical protein
MLVVEDEKTQTLVVSFAAAKMTALDAISE